MFAEFGEIQSAHVQRVGDTGNELSNKGYVSFKNGESAQNAIDAMHKKQNKCKEQRKEMMKMMTMTSTTTMSLCSGRRTTSS